MPRFLFVVMFMLISLPAMAKPVILVVGDSISAGYGIDSSEAWVALLQKKLIKIKSPYSISNASISGETSEGGLVRIIPLLATDDPDIVALNKDLMQADGLHPNVKAQAILAEKIEPYLFPLIK